jgi:Domain of unknown function (DUF3372)
LGSAEEIQQKLAFPIGGPDQASGVIVMALNDSGSAADGTDVDPALSRIVVIFNAAATDQVVPVAAAGDLTLSPIQANGSDPVVRDGTIIDGGNGTVTVPARTVAVLVQPQG